MALTQERVGQFEFLLSKILEFVRNGLSIRDAGICAFYLTAQEFQINESTVRDMVTRRCKVNTDTYYNAIYYIFHGNDMEFKRCYYSFIPNNFHKQFDDLCNAIANLKLYPPDTSPRNMAKLLKRFSKLPVNEKNDIIRRIKINESR